MLVVERLAKQLKDLTLSRCPYSPPGGPRIDLHGEAPFDDRGPPDLLELSAARWPDSAAAPASEWG